MHITSARNEFACANTSKILAIIFFGNFHLLALISSANRAVPFFREFFWLKTCDNSCKRISFIRIIFVYVAYTANPVRHKTSRYNSELFARHISIMQNRLKNSSDNEIEKYYFRTMHRMMAKNRITQFDIFQPKALGEWLKILSLRRLRH